jgi:hypothetical protein
MQPGWYLCPHCGEAVDTCPDPGDGEQQEYVEDCPVCCRPNLISATYSPEDDGFHIEVSAEI